jgi:hypothetical protein
MYETTHNQPNQDLGNQTQSREQTKWGLRQTKCKQAKSLKVIGAPARGGCP